MKIKLRYLILIISILIILVPVHAQDVTSDLLGRINNLRASLGLSPYSLNPALMAAAQSHAQWMVNTGSVSHVEDNGSRPVDRAQANGYNSTWVSENIYMGGLATVDDAWNFWMNSPIHYAGLTSANYDNVGIGTAKGAGGQSFVLVFGVSGSSSNSGSSRSSGSNNSSKNNAAPTANPAIKGNDAFGNIRYELQAGDTLGDVLLLFGYTWDELPALMALNNLSDADITSLKVGEIILVPPKAGTWTPTPFEGTAESTEPASEATEVVSENLQITPEAEDKLLQPVTFNGTNPVVETVVEAPSFVTATATPSPVVTQAIIISTPIMGIIPTPIAENDSQQAAISNPPTWLIGAIAVQVSVLLYATYELVRRWRK